MVSYSSDIIAFRNLYYNNSLIDKDFLDIDQSFITITRVYSEKMISLVSLSSFLKCLRCNISIDSLIVIDSSFSLVDLKNIDYFEIRRSYFKNFLIDKSLINSEFEISIPIMIQNCVFSKINLTNSNGAV